MKLGCGPAAVKFGVFSAVYHSLRQHLWLHRGRNVYYAWGWLLWTTELLGCHGPGYRRRIGSLVGWLT